MALGDVLGSGGSDPRLTCQYESGFVKDTASCRNLPLCSQP